MFNINQVKANNLIKKDFLLFDLGLIDKNTHQSQSQPQGQVFFFKPTERKYLIYAKSERK